MERRGAATGGDSPAQPSSNASSEELVNKKFEAEKKRAARIDFSDVFWLLAFVFVFRQFDILDAIRYDMRIDRYVWDDRLE